MSEGSDNESRLKMLIQQAAGAVAVTQKKLGYRQVMQIIGFTVDEINNAGVYRCVIRRCKAFMNVDGDTVSTPVALVIVAHMNSEISSLTTTSNLDDAQLPAPIADQLAADVAVTPATKEKKHRRSVKELQHFNAKNNANSARQKQAMKVATTRIKRNLDLPAGNPQKKTARAIVEEVNELYQDNVNKQTAARYVQMGLVGISPLKPGPHGDFPKFIYETLQGAYCTYQFK
jgi:hypothetical protein